MDGGGAEGGRGDESGWYSYVILFTELYPGLLQGLMPLSLCCKVVFMLQAS